MNIRFVIKFWLPVLAWMIFIFIGSTDLLSAEHTSRFIGPVLRWFAPGVSEAAIAWVQLGVRKCGHLAEYAILAALLCRALSRNQVGFGRAFAGSLFAAATYAALDEFHQSFVASRTASAWDVLIDCAGVLAGLIIYRILMRRTPRKFEIRNSKFGIH